MNTKKRANKKQREVLLERLHANIELARDNQADERVKEFWANLASELNILGCSRTVQEWQHVWSVWVSKTKTKARKIRRSLHATGGGPEIDADLDDTEAKILEVVGSASVYGHDSIELGITSGSMGPTVPALDVSMTSSASQALDAPGSDWEAELPQIFITRPGQPRPSSQHALSQPTPSLPTPSQPASRQPTPIQPASRQPTPIQPASRQPAPSRNTDLPRQAGGQPRSSRGRSRRPRTNEALIMALNENGQGWRETLLQAAHVIAEAGYGIAAAIRSSHPQPSSPYPQPPSPNA